MIRTLNTYIRNTIPVSSKNEIRVARTCIFKCIACGKDDHFTILKKIKRLFLTMAVVERACMKKLELAKIINRNPVNNFVGCSCEINLYKGPKIIHVIMIEGSNPIIFCRNTSEKSYSMVIGWKKNF